MPKHRARHLALAASLVVFATTSLACLGVLKKDPEMGDCIDYLDCAESTGTPMETLRVTYGEDGLCWEDNAEELCRAQCADALTLLQDAYPNDPVCSAVGDPDPEDTPPACANGLVGTGSDVGDIAMNATFVDTDGREVQLHHYCDRAVLLMVGALWDGATVGSARSFGELGETYDEEDLMLAIVLSDGEEEDWLRFEEDIGNITVWGGVGSQWERDGGIPTHVLIAPGMRLDMVDEGRPNNDEIEDVLP